MLRLDHLIIHIDSDEEILNKLKKKISPLGYPFDPESGKQTTEFKSSNIWIGNQSLELVRLLEPSGSGWERRWVERYNQGHRGACALVIATRELVRLRKELEKKRLQIYDEKKVSPKDIIGIFTDLLGIKKSVPWKKIYLAPIPGTEMEIGFIEYESDAEANLQPFRKPNAEENGITGIHRVKIYLPQWEEGIEYLGTIFPQLTESKAQYRIRLRDTELFFFRSEPGEFSVKLETHSEKKEFVGGKFEIENVVVKTTG
ncbi:hypothetical protein JXM67_03360 [candidate division WOR-3 bacterium]|nr:hypothetical protein [candidate division WOR-3 bacterium]